MNIIIEADKIAEASMEAYSRTRYTTAAWIGIARLLLKKGFSPRAAEWVMKSKHMRWAADSANREHSATTRDFERFVMQTGWAKLLTEATKETAAPRLAHGNDLVGYLEGEDLAAAVNFVIMVATETISNGNAKDDQAQLDILRDKATKLAQALQARAAQNAKK